ncbi:hypothetical protein EGW08_006004 [Elysia chlorotica]|uniref:Secreted protein n=1 Tax=Elysia chlorotica TaxID=188477 RepID=A0A3S1A9M6_ELYCH|nr:hypothetical protein EGW08_006004 [Elysia chlorotica]
MKLQLMTVMMALTGALSMMHGGGFGGGGWGGGLVVSRREADDSSPPDDVADVADVAEDAETPTVAALSLLVDALLTGAKDSITIDAMGVAIQRTADGIVDAQGGEGTVVVVGLV